MKVAAFDVETTSVRVESAELIGLSFVYEDVEGFYFADEIPHEVREVLEDNTILKLAHNASFDRSIMKRYGITVNYVLDTMTLAHILGDTQLSLKHLAELYFFEELEDFKDFRKRCPKPTKDDWARYSIPQSKMCIKLYEALLPEVKKHGCMKLLEDLLIPLVPVLSDLELNGVRVDTEELNKIGQEFRDKAARSQMALDLCVGHKVNPNSPKQVAALMFRELGFRPIRTSSKTGAPSTSSEVLESINHPAAKYILTCRKYGKLAGTYAEKLPKLTHDGRIHASYNICGTRTGRLSSSDPNLQNIPARTADGLRIRKAFIASPGNILLKADYDQLELRMIAMLSGDKLMCEKFRNGEDIHASTAESISELLGRKFPRFLGKTLNFEIVYGASVPLVMAETGLSRHDAQEVRDALFSTYRGVAAWIAKQRAMLRENGYVRTLKGRVRKFPDAAKPTIFGKNEIMKEGINTIVQGSSSELVLSKMIEAWRVFRDTDVKMVLQVHDEVVFELPEHKLSDVLHVLEGILPCYDYSVPFTVSFMVGKDWRDMEEVKGSKDRQYKEYYELQSMGS